ncbi:hypothetical protein CLV47_11824 [Antricoccus suffuscus]|uniref:Uncharacterized protein n=1 Tax=Antricoccus suffuscus TaxID=1629062 RepID=A0A2T0ZTH4_9ACTN|nr:hypothetical protein [Antricoccus suffuscus]PRZ39660.1 hypothetical protein CLV47_11824 [Antricoccus suffuscus]
MSTYISRVALSIAGTQKVAVSSHTMTSDEFPHVTVQAGQLQIVCTEPGAVEAWAEGWAIARDLRAVEAEVPLTARVTEPMQLAIGTIAIMASCNGYSIPTVVGMPSAVGERAYVEVAVDAVTVRAYDQRAITSMLEAWSHAHHLARPTFTDPIDLPQANGHAIQRRRQRAGHTR